MQHTSQLLMIRPANFGYNAETAVNNRFQQKSDNASVHSQALIEFDRLVEALQKKTVAGNCDQ